MALRGEGVVETTSSLVETSSSSRPTRAGSTAGRWSPPSPPRGRRGSPASPSPSPPSPTGSTARRTTWRWTSGSRSTWPTQGQRARASLWLSPPSRSPVPAGICFTDSAGHHHYVHHHYHHHYHHVDPQCRYLRNHHRCRCVLTTAVGLRRHCVNHQTNWTSKTNNL